jgi:phosphoglucomutase
MSALTIPTSPIEGQQPGTSGLRAKSRALMQPGYLENFVQSVFGGTGGVDGKTPVLGGGGRFFNRLAAQVIVNGAGDREDGGGEPDAPAASKAVRHLGNGSSGAKLV